MSNTTPPAPEDIDPFCSACNGRGGDIERQDPVGDGIGFEELFYPCSECLEQGRCPWCAGAVDKEYRCLNEDCGWTTGQLYEPDYEPEWGDY